MQITFKRNGLKNYMIVRSERNGVPGLREKMIVRNEIAYLSKMTPQSIDGHSYFYYDIQGRVSLETVFSGRTLTYAEITVILQGISGLLTELERYLLSPDEVLFAPSDIWLLPDTLEPAFIYVPDVIPDEEHSIRCLAEYLTEHVDGSDRAAAALAYEYLELVENGCIMPFAGPERRTDIRTEPGIPPVTERSSEPPIDPDEYWDIKEGISDEMKPFFEEDAVSDNKDLKKKAAYIAIGLASLAAVVYIVLVLDPALFSISLSDEAYTTAGIVIALVFAIVLISVMRLCGKRGGDSGEQSSCVKEAVPAANIDTKDALEYMEHKDNRPVDDEKTVLISRPAPPLKGTSDPVLKYDDGRKIPLSTFPFIIGKMKARVDGVVEGAGVSRIHAMIKEQDGRYFLSDLNSLNGTGINGVFLDANETAEISDGDVISLAGTSLTFRTKAG